MALSHNDKVYALLTQNTEYKAVVLAVSKELNQQNAIYEDKNPPV